MINFLLVDAFTEQKFAGNACSVVLVNQFPVDSLMLSMAKEFNQSETSFVEKTKETNKFNVRYFTTSSEIPLAGHPTIATAKALLHLNLIILNDASNLTTIQFNLIEGPIDVEIQHDLKKNVDLIVMKQRKPKFFSLHDPDVVLPFFGLEKSDLFPDSLIQTVSTGTKQMMIFLKDKKSLQKAEVSNQKALDSYKDSSDFFCPFLFTMEGIKNGKTFARMIGYGQEDAATGSATGAMSAYLWKYGFLDERKFIAEQGHWLGRPSEIHVEVSGRRDDVEWVKIGGNAAVVLEGLI
ncbi:hypothetical protein HK099_002466 [Clydaea vesicula]|uniref:PhzF family phenazine biosynthesis protein n=1 Tax=Clydaea vesicula TaxID=447962 RepID=A0AAD5U2N7_9FUNG|nr:hypothetical protein HK099_002466 [Clydaea vesicula]